MSLKFCTERPRRPYSRIMRRRHCGCGGLLVAKMVQAVWEKKRNKGNKNSMEAINKKLTGKINKKKKEENKHNIKNI